MSKPKNHCENCPPTQLRPSLFWCKNCGAFCESVNGGPWGPWFLTNGGEWVLYCEKKARRQALEEAIEAWRKCGNYDNVPDAIRALIDKDKEQ